MRNTETIGNRACTIRNWVRTQIFQCDFCNNFPLNSPTFHVPLGVTTNVQDNTRFGQKRIVGMSTDFHTANSTRNPGIYKQYVYV